ncbi:hypothetical protein [Limosilactobacillus secaliphilus]|uniref:hypothetical protein n=1 Tax=Limosilactobacillus secaliphilus TaxID=396268 RepID=UPI0007103B21|nr:hypothetical protein [Limosilactobacillus secaliphilus]
MDKVKVDYKTISSRKIENKFLERDELGVPLYVIQKRVGHENSKITQQIYLHVTQKAIEKEVAKLDEL